jgi:YVTN family beta-propeller protein
VDPVRYIASEGSVSVIRLTEESPVSQIMVGLHSSAIAASPDGRHVVVANAGSDTLSVIDTRTDNVIETICAKASPADLFGASPNALAFHPAGDTLYVANGTQNAIAMFRFCPGKSKLLGLIPVGWFPGEVAYDASRHRLIVANIKGVGSTRGLKAAQANENNTHQYHGSLSLVPVPRAKELPALTRQVLDNYRYPLLKEARQPARPNQSLRPIPERVGEPSVFEHVVYIIKENRTYDQVLGDVPEGPTSTRWCGSSSCWTTSTVPAFSAPTATSGRIPRSPRTTWRNPSPVFRAATPTAWKTTTWMPWPMPLPASFGIA